MNITQHSIYINLLSNSNSSLYQLVLILSVIGSYFTYWTANDSQLFLLDTRPSLPASQTVTAVEFPLHFTSPGKSTLLKQSYKTTAFVQIHFWNVFAFNNLINALCVVIDFSKHPFFLHNCQFNCKRNMNSHSHDSRCHYQIEEYTFNAIIIPHHIYCLKTLPLFDYVIIPVIHLQLIVEW